MLPPNLCGLPQELLVNILGLLVFQDIITCQAVSKLFSRLIKTTAQLQYAIELGVAGLTDSPTCTLPTSKRLAQLREYCAAWKDPIFDCEGTIELENGHRNQFGYRDGVILRAYKRIRTVGVGSANDQSTRCDAIDVLVSTIVGETDEPHPEVVRSWTHQFDDPFDVFAADPAQDLLILNVSLSPQLYRVKFLSLQTGKAHHNARNPTLILPLSDQLLVATDPQILGSLLAFRSVLDGYPYGIIIDWKAGSVQSFPLINTDGVRIGFCLLPYRRLLLSSNAASMLKPPAETIGVYYIHPPPPEVEITVGAGAVTHIEDRLCLSLLRKYGLPTLQDGVPTHRTSFAFCPPCAISNVYPDIRSNAAPFHAQSSLGIIAVTTEFTYTDHSLYYTFITPITTFSDPFVTTLTSMAICPIPWEDWGPGATRWFKDVGQPPLFWSQTHAISAHRVFYRRDRIIDFNTHEIKRDLSLGAPCQPLEPDHEGEEESDEEEPTWPDAAVDGIVCQPTIMPSAGIFKSNIISGLPFRETVLLETLEYSHVIATDGSHIFGIEEDESGTVSIDILAV